MSWGRSVAAAVVVGAIGFLSAGAGGTRLAVQASLLPPGQVTTVSDPGITLTHPADGRLRGFEVSAQVTGVAFAAQAGAADEAVRAGRGRQLCVFSVSLRSFDQASEVGFSPPVPAFDAAVVVGSRRLPLNPDDFSLGGTFVVSVPKGAPVVFELKVAGFAQDYSLTRLARVGPVPAVLYRDPAQPTLVDQVNVTKDLVATNAQAGIIDTEAETLRQATLSYFSPAGSDQAETTVPTAGGANEAVLVLMTSSEALDASGGPGYALGDFPTLPASRVTLRLPDGTTIPSSVTPDPDASGALGASYYFSVPASFSAGQVVVDPGAGVQDVPTQTQVTFAGPISFPVSFPPPPRAAERTGPVPAGLATTTPGQRHHLGQGSPPSRTGPASGGGSALVIGLIAGLGLLVVLVFVALLVRTEKTRRDKRWGFAAGPVRTVVPYTTALLPALAPIALPPAPARMDPGQPFDEPSDPEAEDDHEPVVDVAPVDAYRPELVVRVLGPIEVEGLRQRIGRRALQRLLVHLALHPERTVASDEVRYRLADSKGTEPSAATVHSYVSMLRQALPEGVLPDAGAQAGYRLVGETYVDWVEFRTLLTTRDASSDTVTRAERLRRALSLVRGQPLAHSSLEGLDDAQREMESSIEAAAHELAESCLEHGDGPGAEWAATRGLLGVPASLVLYEDRLAAATTGSGVTLERVWRDARQALGPDASLLEDAYRKARGTNP